MNHSDSGSLGSESDEGILLDKADMKGILPRCRMKMKWTPEEDQLLSEIISWHGASKWDRIAEHIKGRTGKQCRERWITALSPLVSKEDWTKEEDEILLNMQSKLGNQWATIAKVLPGRSSISAKNRFKSLARRGLATMQNTSRNVISTKSPQNTTVIPQSFGYKTSTSSPAQLLFSIPTHLPNKPPMKPLPPCPEYSVPFILDLNLPIESRIRLFN